MQKDVYHGLLPEYSIYPASIGAGAKTGDAIIVLQGFEGAVVVCG